MMALHDTLVYDFEKLIHLLILVLLVSSGVFSFYI